MKTRTAGTRTARDPDGYTILSWLIGGRLAVQFDPNARIYASKKNGDESRWSKIRLHPGDLPTGVIVGSVDRAIAAENEQRREMKKEKLRKIFKAIGDGLNPPKLSCTSEQVGSTTHTDCR